VHPGAAVFVADWSAGSIKVFSAFNAIDRSIGSAEMRVVSSSWSGAVKVITLY